MKLQGLAVIFVLIILPISIVLSEYVQVQIDTLKIQTAYDSQLLSATYDAVVAYQRNTVNSLTSNISTGEIIRDVEASANVFYTSIANNFGMSGSSKDAIKEYVPAIVYTMYDGYYIYTPFDNQIYNTAETIPEGNTYQPGRRFGVKPYVYYSKEYNYNGCSFVITYSLDNYITIQGEVLEEGVKKTISESGYLIDITPGQASRRGDLYKGVPIENNVVQEYVYVNNQEHRYPCIKKNGVKYYKDTDGKIFSLQNNGSTSEVTDGSINFDDFKDAQKFYKDAYDFTNRIINTYGLKGLQSDDSKYIIFEENASKIENYDSGFNQERRKVIKDTIEKNLSASIANFSNISTSSNSVNFQMPKLSEDEWDKIINNISVITFLQGINMGNRPYNGYSIVTNSKNKEVVSEDSIYITTSDNVYHRVTDQDLLNLGTELQDGILNVDFERKSIAEIGDDGSTLGTNYYYAHHETGCYNSIVNPSNIDPLVRNGKAISIYEYLSDKGNNTLSTLYYSALGRERYGMRRINNPFVE